MSKINKIYTKQGDQGYTLHPGKKIAKSAELIQALGEIDELNAHLGLLIAISEDKKINLILAELQMQLFQLGAELFQQKNFIQQTHIAALEAHIDYYQQQLPPLKNFILPGGTLLAAQCHIARTICRRCERTMAQLHLISPLHNPLILAYINRFSDLLFVLARQFCYQQGGQETLWHNS